jgi:hypothetical protein
MRGVLITSQTAAFLIAVMFAPVSAHSESRSVKAACDKKIVVTGDVVAVRDEPRSDAPIVRKVKRGDVLESCWKVIGRDKSYNKCGLEHYDWYLVGAGAPKSGYIPVTCARTL